MQFTLINSPGTNISYLHDKYNYMFIIEIVPKNFLYLLKSDFFSRTCLNKGLILITETTVLLNVKFKYDIIVETYRTTQK